MSEKEKMMLDFAAEKLGLQQDDLANYTAIGEALRNVSSEPVDSGISFGGADFWVTVGNVEYFLTVRRSNNQLAKDSLRAS